MDYKNKEEILKCNHEWKDNLLLYSTVTDCTKCHVKKEDWDDVLLKEALTKSEDNSKPISFSNLMYDELTHDKYPDDNGVDEDGYYDWF